MRSASSALVAAFVAVVALVPTSAASTPRGDASQTVWLCQPQQAFDPCVTNLDTAVVDASGSRVRHEVAPVPSSSFACFYVYPTVSPQAGHNANLVVQPAEIATARAQAAQFSSTCQVYAPMYRQRTLRGLVTSSGRLRDDPKADAVAYESLLQGWDDFLAHDDRGRPFVLIGHSQGAAMLIRLIKSQIDDDAALRRRLVVAIVAGGNVVVPVGRRVGGSFAHIPTCDSAHETGCVIAYSSFPGQPPPDALFGRPGQGVSLQSGQLRSKGLEVACVNPASLTGGRGQLLPIFSAPGSPGAPYVSYPGLYAATCRHQGGATWLEVTAQKRPGDRRPTVTATQAAWGYHDDDVNLALGNLVGDVHLMEGAYRAP